MVSGDLELGASRMKTRMMLWVLAAGVAAAGCVRDAEKTLKDRENVRQTLGVGSHSGLFEWGGHAEG